MIVFVLGFLAGCLLMVVLIAIVACLYVTEPPAPPNVIDINSRRGP